MEHDKRNQLILATDLDGTFIPLDGSEQNRRDLRTLADELQRRNVVLTFVTGRYPESVQQAIDYYKLPAPDWLICDVGTTILRRDADGRLHHVSEYDDALQQLVGDFSVTQLRRHMADVALVRLQSKEDQRPFKASYFVNRSRLAEAVAAVESRLTKLSAPYSIIHSVDPFSDTGLIDLLPAGVSKAFALNWWTDFTGHHHESVVYAGDSGNDLAAFTSGYRAVIVGNADRDVANQAVEAHRRAAWQNRLFLATGFATSGVLEGCRHFGLID
ncbi:MAG: HAD-IIB family hydrolase [Planctomycetaceae bacterium]